MSSLQYAEELLDKVLILDFGSQYTYLIARRLREIGVYSELRRFDATLLDFQAFNPKGVILSGGPSGVYDEGSPHVRSDVWEYILVENIPVLGVCYGLQEIMHRFGGDVNAHKQREFGSAILNLSLSTSTHEPSRLFGKDFPKKQAVWMSHGDSITSLPEGFGVIATTSSCPFAAVAYPEKNLWGVQFHPEVSHTCDGIIILKNFTLSICKVQPTWNMKLFASVEISRIKEKVGENYVVGGLSGGVDSTVAAMLIHKAIGSKFIGVLIDSGLLRDQEAAEVKERLLRIIPDLKLWVVDASKSFFGALKGVVDPEKKRKIIGNEFVTHFEKIVAEIGLPLDGSTFLLQGTLYPDIIESTSTKGPSHTIKTHHNVGGLPEKMNLRLIEPFSGLFKDEVRRLGKELGIDSASLLRHPFPGPGLGIRIIGDVTEERVALLQHADRIFLEELHSSGEYFKIDQAFVVLLSGVYSVGVMGDCRTYEMTAVLRAVTSSDFMTADWHKIPYHVLEQVSSRIINEVKGINRVCYDVTSKPPSTIEWE
ncbi:bifunctional GMP synthase/glutamine amidotransferase protein [Cardiosporidium cionae]|uniref:GMP synthase [glutamine-hydrolyzing] n=1 Tax=Cardiosporidium cionae TaxID=476202 RepID=A0ABQ7JGD4_9APIC|nr:bifunctional GMP synthase/glutamine amidotransferase protein [Cardiosporidium cionae]|eukprot:KAF8822715.1 bifunctional GMP synthase/glutamine amidotransferase protein [Cardiosporidium cionae]